MLKIRIWGPNFESGKISGLQKFIEGIPKVEVLELILETYNDTSEKQIVFDSFMSLPSKYIIYSDLRIVSLQNC